MMTKKEPNLKREKALELIAKRKNVSIEEVEAAIAIDAVDVATDIEITEVTERIRRRKKDDAIAYNPTDAEIIDALEAKMPAEV